MKKTILTIAIILGFGLAIFANPDGGGLFGRGSTEDGYFGYNRENNPVLPNNHNNNYDANGQNGDPTPVGSGIAVLMGLGGAYLVAKKRRKE